VSTVALFFDYLSFSGNQVFLWEEAVACCLQEEAIKSSRRESIWSAQMVFSTISSVLLQSKLAPNVDYERVRMHNNMVIMVLCFGNIFLRANFRNFTNNRK